MKGKALRRAAATSEAYRIDGAVPLIIDTTEYITPEKAHEYLRKNRYNRPTNWKRVEEYSDLMAAGKWQLTPQGIVFDNDGELINGQNRLWAVIYSGVSVYMRVSRGSPVVVSSVLDRGMPQSARDLATRVSGRKHSPVEASIARGVLALKGQPKPSKDVLAEEIKAQSERIEGLFSITAGTKKTKSVIMCLAAICVVRPEAANHLAKHVADFALTLEDKLRPLTPAQCWGKGAAFVLAMEKAKEIISV
jgi:hypothetical protein